MFESIFGIYSVLIASARASYAMIEVIRQSPNTLKFLGPKWSQKCELIPTYDTDFTAAASLSLFFLLTSILSPNGLQMDALHDGLHSYAPIATHEAKTPML